MKKIVFITGTRADYGKLKVLIQNVENSEDFEAYVYVSGMHLQKEYGGTYEEVLSDHYKHVQVAFGLANTREMSFNLGNIICDFSGYVKHICPDMIVVHGDRIDALAGAAVGALNNILVAHIEGGELSGTIDESIRHAISKLSHIHLVCNERAKQRLVQLGEEERRIYLMGSPDIDIMYSEKLPDLDEVCSRYDIPFERYAILMYHPVTTEYNQISHNIQNILSALEKSQYNYVVIYPNNDLGSELILCEYEHLAHNAKFRIFPSIRFEHFLTLLKNAEFMIGNSSAGVRETCVYGIPTIDIGSRQSGRYDLSVSKNIVHVEERTDDILNVISDINTHRTMSSAFGNGNSAQIFMQILKEEDIWNIKMQKHFVDMIF